MTVFFWLAEVVNQKVNIPRTPKYEQSGENIWQSCATLSGHGVFRNNNFYFIADIDENQHKSINIEDLIFLNDEFRIYLQRQSDYTFFDPTMEDLLPHLTAIFKKHLAEIFVQPPTSYSFIPRPVIEAKIRRPYIPRRSRLKEQEQKSPTSLVTEFCFAQDQGQREYMEDTYINYEKKETKTNFYAVCDGHGGVEVAKKLSEELAPFLYEQMIKHGIITELSDYSDKPNNITPELILSWKVRLEYFFEAFDFIKFFGPEFGSVGSTCCMIISQGSLKGPKRIIIILNLGDSRALIVSDNNNILFTTRDQKPTNPDEKIRIKIKGGKLVNNRIFGNLAVARAFGDNQLKPAVGFTPQVDILIPDNNNEVNEKRGFIGSDGIFDILSNEDILNIYLKNKNNICQEIINQVKSKKSPYVKLDNLTIISFPL